MQGAAKQYMETELFEFAFWPDFFAQLDRLAEMALPEAWRFREPDYAPRNDKTPILERYLKDVFRLLAIRYNQAEEAWAEEAAIMTCGRGACFHTGLFSRTYKGIYAYFIPNRKDASMRKWHFKDFCEENSPLLKYTVPLPQRPQLIMNARSEAFHPGWPIRVNARHILEDAENLSRIPQALQSFGNLPLLLDAAVELGRRQALAEPGIIAPQFYHGRMQFLMPLYLSGRQKADLAMALSIGDGYYIGETCLTPQMAYLNARLLARPTAGWLRELT